MSNEAEELVVEIEDYLSLAAIPAGEAAEKIVRGAERLLGAIRQAAGTVREVRRGTTRLGDPFAAVTLVDRPGTFFAFREVADRLVGYEGTEVGLAYVDHRPPGSDRTFREIEAVVRAKEAER